MVEQLDIIHFKSIRQQQVKLGRINLLIGQNGAGKSNFISAFVLLEKLAIEDLANYIIQKGGFETFLWNGLEGGRSLGFLVKLANEGIKYNFI